MTHDRRSFLKHTGAALSAAAAAGCVPGTPPGEAAQPGETAKPGEIAQPGETAQPGEAARPGETAQPGRDLAGPLLDAVGAVVLPAELGDEGRAQAVADFAAWVRDYRAVPELNHGYGTHEIRYGPPDPAPGWRAQLDALDLEAHRRHGAPFAEIDGPARHDLVTAAMAAEGGTGLPSPLRARHVATALMAHWFGSSEAVDLCYGRRVSPRTCRNLERSSAEPEALS